MRQCRPLPPIPMSRPFPNGLHITLANLDRCWSMYSKVSRDIFSFLMELYRSRISSTYPNLFSSSESGAMSYSFSELLGLNEEKQLNTFWSKSNSSQSIPGTYSSMAVSRSIYLKSETSSVSISLSENTLMHSCAHSL